MDKKKIMVVDDDPDILFTVNVILKRSGFTVFSYDRGDDFHQHIKENNPDVVLIDIHIAGTDGRQLCKSLKENEAYKHIPVMLFSANKHYKSELAKYYCDEFVEKPFNIDDFIKTIARMSKQNSESSENK